VLVLSASQIWGRVEGTEGNQRWPKEKALTPRARSLTLLNSSRFAKQCAAGPGDRPESSTAQLDDLEYLKLDVEGTKTPVRRTERAGELANDQSARMPAFCSPPLVLTNRCPAALRSRAEAGLRRDGDAAAGWLGREGAQSERGQKSRSRRVASCTARARVIFITLTYMRRADVVLTARSAFVHVCVRLANLASSLLVQRGLPDELRTTAPEHVLGHVQITLLAANATDVCSSHLAGWANGTTSVYGRLPCTVRLVRTEIVFQIL
jgi:hypothetical protein